MARDGSSRDQVPLEAVSSERIFDIRLILRILGFNFLRAENMLTRGQ
jgi:hypothetical protein